MNTHHLDLHLRYGPGHLPVGTTEILAEHKDRVKELVKHWSAEHQQPLSSAVRELVENRAIYLSKSRPGSTNPLARRIGRIPEAPGSHLRRRPKS